MCFSLLSFLNVKVHAKAQSYSIYDSKSTLSAMEKQKEGGCAIFISYKEQQMEDRKLHAKHALYILWVWSVKEKMIFYSWDQTCNNSITRLKATKARGDYLQSASLNLTVRMQTFENKGPKSGYSQPAHSMQI